MIHQITAETPLRDSFRIRQCAGLFDIALEKKARVSFEVDVPGLEEEWQIGVIVGPSGSGKSTVARHAYGADFVTAAEWPHDRAVIECFTDPAGNDLDIRTVTQLLTSVGFSSPPSWLKPYQVLSNGEKFRCDLARALCTERPVVAVDEFTSVVDRTVAKIGSAAVAKSIRAGRVARRFVAVTCHYDVLDWLGPDWVLDMATSATTRGRLLRRPSIELHIAPVHHTAWELFRRHHYLDTSLVRSAHCFVACWNDQPVAFSAWVNRMISGKEGRVYGEHRTVVLPDYQGLGIGNRLSEYIPAIVRGMGLIARSTTSHPAMIGYRSASPMWRRLRLGMAAPRSRGSSAEFRNATSRNTAGFEYVGPPARPELAASYWHAQPAPFLGAAIYRELLAAAAASPGCTAAALARRLGVSARQVETRAAPLLPTPPRTRASASKK
jgi:alpha-D-ribose 1-methylphosphonate 5-triphosphate synthase subunit PhnL/GNAT superfamily N-acetyltransferase